MRLPGARIGLGRDALLERVRRGGKQRAQHGRRCARDRAAIGLEQRTATDVGRSLGLLYRQVLRDADEGVGAVRGDRVLLRLHDQRARGFLPAGAGQAFREWHAGARCGQRPERPVVGLTGKGERGHRREAESPGVSIHRPPPERVRDALSLIERMAGALLMRCRVVT